MNEELTNRESGVKSSLTNIRHCEPALPAWQSSAFNVATLIDWIASSPVAPRNDGTLTVIAGKMLNQVQHDTAGRGGSLMGSVLAVIDNTPARSAHKGRLTLHPSPLTRASRIHSVTLGLRLALNATARACGQKSGFARRALDSSLRSVAPLGLAFTMAEILLSLTIIGVVAAITLPSLTGNINERTWTTQRKALYSRMTQAIALMPALNNYGSLKGTISEPETAGDAYQQNITEDTAAETFITSGLSKVLKINNICDSEHLSDCGLPAQYISTNGTKTDMPKSAIEFTPLLGSGNISPRYTHLDTKTAGLETANGESIAVIYIPDCQPSKNENVYYLTQRKLCALMIYDLNGKKGPNTVGKDIGLLSVFYPTDSVVSLLQPAIRPSDGNLSYDDAVAYCRSLGEEYRLPSKEEAASIVYAGQKMYTIGSGLMWTSTAIVKNGVVNYWVQGYGGDTRPMPKDTSGYHAWCIQRF